MTPTRDDFLDELATCEDCSWSTYYDGTGKGTLELALCETHTCVVAEAVPVLGKAIQ